MSKKVAPPKATGGGGEIVESKVVAYFLSCLLSGTPPLDPKYGTISRIDFQVKVDGWFLDDILLTLISRQGRRFCAISAKSNQQFTRSQAPQEFVQKAWKQFLHDGSDQFDSQRDLLTLVSDTLHPDLHKKLSALLQLAQTQDSRDLPRRLNTPQYASKDMRSLFESFACPVELVEKYHITEFNTGELLRTIQVLPFDFEVEPSSRLKEGIRYCQNALESGSLQEAEGLWEKLEIIADKYKPKSGYLDLPNLLKELSGRFRLKKYPDYKQAWQFLKTHTQENLKVIRDTIGGRVTIPRIEELKRLGKSLEKSKSVALLGPPGCGKTVLAKLFAKAKMSKGQKVVWFDANNLKDLNRIESKLNNFSLKEVLPYTTAPVAYVIIDGLDRTFEEEVFRNLHSLLDALNFNEQNSPWRVLITCQIDEWNRVRTSFKNANINYSWNLSEIGVPEPAELKKVWNAFPQLIHIAQRLELQDLLLKPKILDLLASNLLSARSINITGWVGESDLIEWFWNEIICKGSEGQIRAAFLKQLAKKQADERRMEIPLDDLFQDSQLKVIDSLQRDGICDCYEEKVAFDHPLYSDWVRQRILVGQAGNLKEYLKARKNSPLWQRAIRLYGLYLIEHKGISEWKSAFDLFNTEEERVIQYRFIESVIFAANSLRFLDDLWPILKADEADLLHHLLRAFLIFATTENPLILKSAREWGIDSKIVASTIQRLPWIPYWRPMIRFLHKHLEEILEINFVQILVVALTYAWLTLPFPELNLRKEAADLALSIAERARQKTKRGEYLSEDLREGLYKAAPETAGDLPERFTRLAIDASGRIAPFKEREVQKYRMTDPWPKGPKQRPDSAFQKVCLIGNGLNQTILSNPRLAQRLILALLIKPPRTITNFYRETPLPLSDDMCQIVNNPRWPPPSFGWGPFLFFLESKPAEGLEVIINLVNFATERWVENSQRLNEAQTPTTVLLPNDERKLLGDVSVYYWYRDNTYAPGPVASALMALEKWLYNKIDSNEPVDEIIQSIFNDSISVASFGVLSAVGRKDPSLFSGPLLPLLTVPEFLFWESRYYIGSGFDTPTMWEWVDYGKEIFNKIQKWHTLPHRKDGLDTFAFKLYGEEDAIRAAINQARKKWNERQQEEKDERLKGYLHNLIFWFDPKNWKEESDTRDQGKLIFEMPEETRAKIQSRLKAREGRESLMKFPYLCRDAINLNRSLPEENLEEFWGFLQSIPERTQAIELPSDIAPIENSLCGGAAVLLLLHEDWLNKYPERKKWCKDQILETFKKLYPPRRFDSDISWDKFCAQAIPKLWAENPNSTELRDAVILLTSDRNYSIVQTLFSSTSKYRHQLGGNFQQLQNFILRWAGVRLWRDLSIRFLDDESLEEIKDTLPDRLTSLLGSTTKPYIRWKNWKKSLIDCHHWLSWARVEFLKGSISEQIPSLDEIIVERPSRGKKLPYRVIKGLDLTLIQVAYDWLPSLGQAIDEQERKRWIEFWKDALSYTIDIFINTPEDRRDQIFPIREWKRWLLEHIASLIIQLKPEELPSNYWKSILELGAPAHDFIEDFLQEWFRQNLKTGLVPEVFAREWRAMVEFAFTSPEWNFDSIEKWFDLENLWCNLMGFGFSGQLTDISRDIWEKGSKELITGMRDLYQRWADEHLQRPRCALSFVLFLERPAAEPLLLDGLIRLEKASSQADETYWQEHHLIDAVSSLIIHCWENHLEKLRQNLEAFTSFTKLVNRLAGYGNPTALVIYDKMASA